MARRIGLRRGVLCGTVSGGDDEDEMGACVRVCSGRYCTLRTRFLLPSVWVSWSLGNISG